MNDPVYLDYAATTPVDPRVSAYMFECIGEFGNPASRMHQYGRRAQQIIEQAADNVATLINCAPEEIIWTSGATESDNLAIAGAANFRRMRGQHIVTTAIEHKAVLECCGWLAGQGFEISYVQPDELGVVDPAAIAAALRPDTVLVSVMHANNETGVIQDVAAIGRLCRNADVLFHVDAAQSFGKLLIDVRDQCIDLLSVNAHKACGPKGIGALYLNSDRIRRVTPLLHGGGQQRGIRPGTLPVHQIAGLGATASILSEQMGAEVPRIQSQRDRLWAGIRDLPGLLLNGAEDSRLCSVVNVSVAGVEGESLIYALSDLAVSSGSACNSATDEPSYVLRSLGRSDLLAEASIRFSLGRFTTNDDIAQAIRSFRLAVSYLRSLAPSAQAQEG
jgi:cysteine desulfurase